MRRSILTGTVEVAEAAFISRLVFIWSRVIIVACHVYKKKVLDITVWNTD